ncbi:MAG: hypothetical protein ABI405_00290 [Parafilimonas sp.]
MENLHDNIKELQLSLQTLLKKYNALKKENDHLKKINDEINKQLSEKEKLIETSEEKLATNNITSFYNAEDKQILQSKIDIYLKDIEKCLALLNA